MFSTREATLGLGVLLRRWRSLRNNLRTEREVRHVCYCEVCAPASSFPCFINSHILSLCLSQFSVYYLCRFVTVCILKKMWTGVHVTVIFHILSIRKHFF